MGVQREDNKENRETEKRYYITEVFHLKGQNPFEEKKEFGRSTDKWSAKNPARKDGNYTILRFVEEEVSYMMDYVFDEENQIVEKHRVPVVISKKEGTCFFGKDDGCE